MKTGQARRTGMAAVASSIGAGIGMSIRNRASASAPAGGATVITVRDFGARGDGKDDETAAFQRALDSVGQTGGTVALPDGVYLLRNLSIRAHTTLWPYAGAQLHVMHAPTAR